MTISILHLSDLHRDIHEEADNDSLLFSLERDFKNYRTATPTIEKPNICVVSGDLIFGSKQIGEQAFTEIATQYHQTKLFLISLADILFDGNRDKIIITPGNHDVCHEIVRTCIRKIPPPETPQKKQSLRRLLHSPSGDIRWSWEDLCFYEIIDKNRYNERFKLFAEMYNDFYQEKRTFSLEPTHQWDIFDFPDLSTCIGSLNSCYNNDQFRSAGEIHPTALSNLCKEMTAPKRQGWFLAVTWHHNTSGPPMREDYVSPSFLPTLIETGIGLGLHGHQHSPDCFDEHHRYGPEKKWMTIISASTLCSGSHHLASGVPRSYNIIEIRLDEQKGRVHQRAMVGADIKYPSWRPGVFLQTQKPFVDFVPVAPVDVRPPDLDLNVALGEAEKALSSKKWDHAVELLEPYKDDQVARMFLVDALENINDDKKTIEILSPPTTIPEAILVGGAIASVRDKELAMQYLMNPFVKNSNDASLHHIKRTVERI